MKISASPMRELRQQSASWSFTINEDSGEPYGTARIVQGGDEVGSPLLVEWLLQRGQLKRESCNEIVSFEKPHPANVQSGVLISRRGSNFCLSRVSVRGTRLHSSNMANMKTEPCLKMIALGDSRYFGFVPLTERGKNNINIVRVAYRVVVVQCRKDIPSAPVCARQMHPLPSYHHWYRATHKRLI
jgi:hypothetical protein